MTITLTQKDADFILAYLRASLERLNDNCDKVHDDTKRYEAIKAKIKEGNDPSEKLLLKVFDGDIRRKIEEYHRLYKEQTDLLARCIGLLTTGSNMEEKQ